MELKKYARIDRIYVKNILLENIQEEFRTVSDQNGWNGQFRKRMTRTMVSVH